MFSFFLSTSKISDEEIFPLGKIGRLLLLILTLCDEDSTVDSKSKSNEKKIHFTVIRMASNVNSDGKRIDAKDYHELKELIVRFGQDRRVFVLFCGAKTRQGHSWCSDCVASEKSVEETVQSSLPSNGIFIECSVGDQMNWKDANNIFRKDSKLRLTNIPTLVEWGTSKRITGNQLLDPDMIKILFEDDE